MQYSYGNKVYTGTREEIVANIKKDLAGYKIYGTFTLGEEIIDIEGEIGDIREKLMSKVHVPYKLGGITYSKDGLVSELMCMDKSVLVDLIMEKI